MYRYVVLIWAAEDERARGDAERLRAELATDWPDAREVMAENGIAAFVPAVNLPAWQTLAQPGRGVIFGRLFRNGDEAGESTPSSEEWDRILATGGGHLLRAWWGRYVALFRKAHETEVSILRDPSGGLPCFVSRHRRVWIVFSDIAICRNMLSLSVNWQHVAGYLKCGGAPASQTGLREITEVQPGERVLLRVDRIHREQLWDPLDNSMNDPVESVDSAAIALRETLERCVHAWATLHGSIVHLLSGGLDSSVVLSCLSSAPTRPTVVCLHAVSSVAHEEERQYARLAAEHAGCELRELTIDPGGNELAQWLPRLRASARPMSAIHEALTGAMSASVAASMGATAITSGVAGDSLFFQPAAEFAPADFVRRHGIRSALWGVSLNAARISGDSVWSVLWHAISQRALSRKLQRSFASAAAIEAIETNARRGVPVGLSMQLLGVSVSVPFYGQFDHGLPEPDRCPVLLSQPIMELCLRIPSHVWIAAGCDRAVARLAFADRIPPDIWQRTAKGSANACYSQLVERNSSFIATALLDGILAEKGWIDRRWIASQFSGRRLSGFEHEEILHRYLCTEFWLRNWLWSSRSASATRR